MGLYEFLFGIGLCVTGVILIWIVTNYRITITLAPPKIWEYPYTWKVEYKEPELKKEDTEPKKEE